MLFYKVPKECLRLFRMQASSSSRFANCGKMSISFLHDKCFINGSWVDAKSGKTFEVKNPATGEVIGVAPDMDVEDTRDAIKAAADAFPSWAKTPAKERGVLLRKWYDLMVSNSDEIAKILTWEAGKPLAESKGEITYGNSFIDWFAEEARRIHGEVLQSPVRNREMVLLKQPIGVAALITPWNFPHAMITRKAGAALAAGCTCVIRPAEDTPFTALALVDLADKAGIPKGVINIVTSGRPHAAPIGKELCENPLVAGLSFTGSTEVGKLLYKQCATGIKRVGLELGGNAPFIVFNSADINKAVEGAIASKFRNCGQTCVSANRFIIQDGVFDEFVEKLRDRMRKFKLGNGMESGVDTGPLINAAQVKKVESIVKDAVDKGAKVLHGGERASNFGELFYMPTLLIDIKPNMACYTEEIFGPVAVCLKFKTEEEAVAISNGTSRGLAGYFYSNDLNQAWRVARNLEVGMIGINEGIISAAEAAFGGIKESGIGREGSSHGIEEFVYIKYLCFGGI